MDHTHTVVVDLSQISQPGEHTYTCTECKQPITLVWEGVMQDGKTFTPTAWSLRHADQWENPIGEVRVQYGP